MAGEGFKRKLTTMFSADVAGYSRLMAEDEAATVNTLKAYHEIMTELIRQHRGRVVDSPGDNVLAEFTSVVDGVQCAVAVQKELQARNAELPEDRRMEFRIGINLGDVIEEEDRIYGDGVNITARLEALADPGGICVSKTAFDQIETKLPLGYEYLGEQPVKNIPKPVGAYRVLMERRQRILIGGVALVLVVIGALIWNFYLRPPAVEVASVEKMAYPLPDKPSIAVLPFVNMSGDPDQEYFADGLTEDIITVLSKTPDLFVIARLSTFTYKDKPVEVQQIGRELGVRYVLEGSVQRADDTVRITAQLIDATTGHHVWAERYDRELKGVFAVRDDVTQSIVATLIGKDSGKLMEAEIKRAFGKESERLDAYDYVLRGTAYLTRFTKEANAEAKRLFKKAIELDPEYARAYTGLAHALHHDVEHGFGEQPDKSLEHGFRLARKAVALDASDYRNHWVLGMLHLARKEHAQALAAYERAYKLNASDANFLAERAGFLIRSGRGEEALVSVKRALRVNPFHPEWYTGVLGWAYFDTGQYENAIDTFRKLSNPPGWVRRLIAASLAQLDRMHEARTEVEKYLEVEPNFSLRGLAEDIRKTRPFRDPEHLARYLRALRKAGLPD
jgi:adenylate cyclase